MEMTKNMQKLLDLFNEYNYIQAEGERDTYTPRTEKDWLGMSKPYQYYIISKHFEFVKWLENEDKINTDKLWNIDDTVQSMVVEMDTTWENTILMLLAIQAEPLNFLADIIK